MALSTVTIIGDRLVGKTWMIYALAGKYQALDITNAELCGNNQRKVTVLQGPKDESVTGTLKANETTLKLKVELAGNSPEFAIQWIDTVGESFSKDIRSDEEKQKAAVAIKSSRYIILLLPPLGVNSCEESRKAFRENYLPLLVDYGENARNILICRNKFDEVVGRDNLRKIVNDNKLDYSTSGFRWNNYNDYAKTYFGDILELAREHTKNHDKHRISFFLTTVYCRPLLESPWIYLATYESQK